MPPKPTKPTHTASVQELRKRYQAAQERLASAKARVEQADAAYAEATEKLQQLGFLPDKPIGPQVEAMRRDTEKLLTEVEGKLNDADRVFGRTSD